MKIKDIIGKRMKIKPVVINGKAIIRSRTNREYEMLFDRMTPKYRMINKLRNMVILRQTEQKAHDFSCGRMSMNMD